MVIDGKRLQGEKPTDRPFKSNFQQKAFLKRVQWEKGDWLTFKIKFPTKGVFEKGSKEKKVIDWKGSKEKNWLTDLTRALSKSVDESLAGVGAAWRAFTHLGSFDVMMMMMMMRMRMRMRRMRRRRRRGRRSTANMFSSTLNLSELVVGLAGRLEGRSGGKHKPGK